MPVPTRPVEVPLALFEAVAEIELELEPVPTGTPLLAAEVVVMLALKEGADTTCEDELVPTMPVEVPFALFEAVAEIKLEVEPVPTGILLLLEEEFALAELTSVGVWLVVELEDTAAEDDVVMTVEELAPVPGIVLFIDTVEERVGLIGSAVLVLDGPAVLIEDEDEDEERLLVGATDEDGEELTLLDEVVDGEAELVLDEVVDGEAELVLDEVVDGEAELELDGAELALLEVVETTDKLELGEIAAASPQSPKSESQFLPQ